MSEFKKIIEERRSANNFEKGLKIPERYEIALLVTMGKENPEKRRMRGYRKPIGEYVSYNSL